MTTDIMGIQVHYITSNGLLSLYTLGYRTTRADTGTTDGVKESRECLSGNAIDLLIIRCTITGISS